MKHPVTQKKQKKILGCQERGILLHKSTPFFHESCEISLFSQVSAQMIMGKVRLLSSTAARALPKTKSTKIIY
jgi:hypothetical protein